MRLSAFTKAARAARRSGGGVSPAIYGLGDPDLYLKMMLHLTVGMLIDHSGRSCVVWPNWYTRNDQAFQRGTFRVRGEVIDVFPAELTISPCALSCLTKRSSVCRHSIPPVSATSKTVPRYTIYPKTHSRNAAGAHRPGDGRDRLSWRSGARCQ
ncbi:hypothetical protein LNP74_33400 [Klebsiella pneumoniae subsp. pneumoniae]|nr:hypothetical protein [Klebsiella pneumoniae subsp. pneumoniae]